MMSKSEENKILSFKLEKFISTNTGRAKYPHLIIRPDFNIYLSASLHLDLKEKIAGTDFVVLYYGQESNVIVFEFTDKKLTGYKQCISQPKCPGLSINTKDFFYRKKLHQSHIPGKYDLHIENVNDVGLCGIVYLDKKFIEVKKDDSQLID